MTKTLLATFALSVASTALFAQAAPEVDTSVFPAAKPGMTQHIFQPAPNDSEVNYLVEIVAGQIIPADCNTVTFGADFEDETLDGWGYSYYEIEDVTPVVSTMMACPDEKVERFVPANMGQDAFLRYNSRMPIVVYAPEGLLVGYRIWQTDGELLGLDE